MQGEKVKAGMPAEKGIVVQERGAQESITVVEAGNVARKAVRGALWQVLGGGWQTVVRLGASVFLARALRPEDFGVFGMALLVREFLNSVGALGMGAGVIAKKEVTQADLATCFWTMAGARTLMFLAGFFGAPLAGYFLGDARVVPVVRAVSFLFLTSILEVVSQTLLTKELQFGKLNLIRGIGTLFESSLAVVLAVFTGLGYWALVYAMLASSIGMSIAVFFVAGWRPSFVFDGESFRYMFRFGISGLGFSIANYLKQNVDYLIVARLLGSGGLGLYEFAYRLPHLVLDRISRPIGSVFFPFFSKIQDNESLLLTYVNSVSIVTLITWPLVFGLAGIARVAVPLLWGDQWLATIEPLQVLCLGAGLRCLAQPSGAIFLSRNKPELQLWLGIGELAFTLIAVGTLGGLFGLIGVAAGMSLSAFPPLVSTHIALHLLGKNISFLFRSVGPTAISAVICGSMAYCVSQALPSVPWVKLGVSIAVGAALYVGMLALVSRQLLLLFFGTLKRLVGTPR